MFILWTLFFLIPCCVIEMFPWLVGIFIGLGDGVFSSSVSSLSCWLDKPESSLKWPSKMFGSCRLVGAAVCFLIRWSRLWINNWCFFCFIHSLLRFYFSHNIVFYIIQWLLHFRHIFFCFIQWCFHFTLLWFPPNLGLMPLAFWFTTTTTFWFTTRFSFWVFTTRHFGSMWLVFQCICIQQHTRWCQMNWWTSTRSSTPFLSWCFFCARFAPLTPSVWFCWEVKGNVLNDTSTVCKWL